MIAQDNLYFLGFAIQYTGTGTVATMTVSATALTTAITGAAADNLNLLFSQYPTLAQLISAINGTGKYAVTLASTSGNYRAANLDTLPATNILTAPVSVTGITNAVIEFLNLTVSGQVVAIRGVGTIPAVASGYLVGGTEYGAGGTITTAHWQTALDQSRTIDAQLCCAATANPTIQALCKTNADFMNDGRQGKMERMWYLGCANGETLATALTNASALNSPACLYVYPGGRDYDPTGLIRRSNGDPEVVNIPGYYLAATLAGVKAGGGVEEPLSRASVQNCLGLQTDLTYTQLTDQVEDGGICALIKGQASFVPGGSNASVTVWHGITTYVGSANFARHIESIQLVNQYVARTIRDAVSDYLAAAPRKVASVTTKASLKALVEARFRNLERQGIIVGSVDKEAFSVEDNGITFEGTAITVKACYYPAKPIEMVFIDLQALDLSF